MALANSLCQHALCYSPQHARDSCGHKCYPDLVRVKGLCRPCKSLFFTKRVFYHHKRNKILKKLYIERIGIIYRLYFTDVLKAIHCHGYKHITLPFKKAHKHPSSIRLTCKEGEKRIMGRKGFCVTAERYYMYRKIIFL